MFVGLVRTYRLYIFDKYFLNFAGFWLVAYLNQPIKSLQNTLKKEKIWLAWLAIFQKYTTFRELNKFCRFQYIVFNIAEWMNEPIYTSCNPRFALLSPVLTLLLLWPGNSLVNTRSSSSASTQCSKIIKKVQKFREITSHKEKYNIGSSRKNQAKY